MYLGSCSDEFNNSVCLNNLRGEGVKITFQVCLCQLSTFKESTWLVS